MLSVVCFTNNIYQLRHCTACLLVVAVAMAVARVTNCCCYGNESLVTAMDYQRKKLMTQSVAFLQAHLRLCESFLEALAKEDVLTREEVSTVQVAKMILVYQI